MKKPLDLFTVGEVRGILSDEAVFYRDLLARTDIELSEGWRRECERALYVLDCVRRNLASRVGSRKGKKR